MQRALDLASAGATHLDAVGTASRRAGSPFGQSTYCVKYAFLPSQARLWSLPRPLLQGGTPPSELPGGVLPRLAAPRVCLAWRLRDFATNCHE